MGPAAFLLASITALKGEWRLEQIATVIGGAQNTATAMIVISAPASLGRRLAPPTRQGVHVLRMFSISGKGLGFQVPGTVCILLGAE